MYVKPNKNPKYDGIKAGAPGHEPARESLQVFDPARKDYLPAHGRDVGEADSLYWHNRARGGEVEVLSAEEGKAAEAAAQAEQDKANKAAEQAAIKAKNAAPKAPATENK